jgi:hypothetical protein
MFLSFPLLSFFSLWLLVFKSSNLNLNLVFKLFKSFYRLQSKHHLYSLSHFLSFFFFLLSVDHDGRLELLSARFFKLAMSYLSPIMYICACKRAGDCLAVKFESSVIKSVSCIFSLNASCRRTQEDTVDVRVLSFWFESSNSRKLLWFIS